MQRLNVELFLRLDPNRMATRPLRGFRDGERVVPVVLLRFGERPDTLGGQEPHIVPHRDELVRQPMRARTSFEGDVEVLLSPLFADSNEAGHAFQTEAGHLFQFHSGHRSD